MTVKQAQRVAAKLEKIRTLAEQASAIFGDDPEQGGEVYTALSNITAGADWALEVLTEQTGQFQA